MSCYGVSHFVTDPGPHVHPIRTNQKAVIRAWHGDGGGSTVSCKTHD